MHFGYLFWGSLQTENLRVIVLKFNSRLSIKVDISANLSFNDISFNSQRLWQHGFIAGQKVHGCRVRLPNNALESLTTVSEVAIVFTIVSRKR